MGIFKGNSVNSELQLHKKLDYFIPRIITDAPGHLKYSVFSIAAKLAYLLISNCAPFNFVFVQKENCSEKLLPT